jgi:hypothetical protein
MDEPKQLTHDDFDALSWHDCHVWGLEIRAGDPDEQDWTSDLVLDIDFIVEWVCAIGGGGDARFRVAPARLVFHGVTDPSVSIRWSEGDLQAAIHPLSIDHIERKLVTDQRVYLDRPYYSWRVILNWPRGGEIAFGAVGFTQTLLGQPLLTFRQHLTRAERSRVSRASS